MRRFLIGLGYALAGLVVAVTLTAGAYAIAGRELSRPARQVRLPAAEIQQRLGNIPAPVETRSPEDSRSDDDRDRDEDRSREEDNSGSGSDNSGSGSDNSGSGSSNSGSGSDRDKPEDD